MPAELPAEIPVELILPGTPTHDVPVDVVDDEPSGVAGDTINVPAGGDITDVVADDVEVAPKGDTVSDVVGGSGLTPPLPISNEPNGIPARAAPPGVVGDVAAADEALLLAVVPQGPDIAVLPGIDVPVPIDIPPPSKVGVDPDIADDALPVVVQGNGLSPGEASCVTPMGMPVGGTCEPGVMPSGEVAAILGVGLPIPPTCARAEPQLSSTVAAVTIAKRVIMGSTFYSRSRRSLRLPVRRGHNAIKRQDMASRGLLRLVRCCFDRMGDTAIQTEAHPAQANLSRRCPTLALTRCFDDSCSASAR